MTKLADLFDRVLFVDMVTAGYIRLQTHPTRDLVIANYTEKAQFEKVWNPVTLACRGLIFDDDTEIIHARPYSKFFNYGDHANTGPLDMFAPVHVTDKLDGSLGISYPTPDGPAIATRGSFTSDQALHATALLRSKYPGWRPVAGVTYLFEIVYPENRIVVDYDDTDDLFLHGVIDIATGHVESGWFYGWPGPRATPFSFDNMAAALAAPPRPNAEGMVVRFENGLMVKIKQDDYVALHRIVTGLNERTVWEWLGDGKTVGDLCATLPDDFHAWVEEVAARLHREQSVIITRAVAAFAGIAHLQGDRKAFAQAAQQVGTLFRPYLFLILDKRYQAVVDAAWRFVKPAGNRSMINSTEAVA